MSSAAVCFEQSDDHVDPLGLETVAFLEHLIGLADPCAVTEVDLQAAALAASDHPEKCIGSVLNHGFPQSFPFDAVPVGVPSRARFSMRTLTRGSPRIPRSRPSV